MMDFNRHCAEIVAQTALLTGYLDGADLRRPVPTCPGWNASQLMRHVDGGRPMRGASRTNRRSTVPTPPSRSASISCLMPMWRWTASTNDSNLVVCHFISTFIHGCGSCLARPDDRVVRYRHR